MDTQTANLSAQLIELADTYGAHNYHPLPIVITTAKGIWVKDPARYKGAGGPGQEADPHFPRFQ